MGVPLSGLHHTPLQAKYSCALVVDEDLDLIWLLKPGRFLTAKGVGWVGKHSYRVYATLIKVSKYATALRMVSSNVKGELQ